MDEGVVTDPTVAAATPTRWFDGDAAAAKALGTSALPEGDGQAIV